MGPPERPDDRQRLLRLCDLAQQWVKENADDQRKTPTDAYVSLMFAFGLARLGEADTARELLNRAAHALTGKDEVHTFLLEAFRFRITAAIDGRPHAGPLPPELLAATRQMRPLFNYVIDKLRRYSRVLEPDEEIEPYRRHLARASSLAEQIAELPDIRDRNQIVTRVQEMLKATPERRDGLELRARVLKAALEAAPRADEEFAKEMLEAGRKVYAALREPQDTNQVAERATFLEKALLLAAHFGRVGDAQAVVDCFERLLQERQGVDFSWVIERIAWRCFGGLRKLGMREQIDRLLPRMAALVLGDDKLESLGPAKLRALVVIAGEWYLLERNAQAEKVLEQARQVLLVGSLWLPEHGSLACAYACAIGHAPVTIAQERLEEIFTRMHGIKDHYTTSSYFSLSQLRLVEAVVLSVVESWEQATSDKVTIRGEDTR
jgi:hypothetical protein